MDQGYIRVSSGKLFYTIKGGGQPIIFLHGFALDSRMWQRQVDIFSKNYRVISYDLRGFGKSSLPEDMYSHHEDLRTLLDHLKIDRAHIVSLSLGGEVGIDFSLYYPKRVRTLTVIDSSLGGFPCPVDWNVHAGDLGIDNAKKSWLNHEVFKSTRGHTEVFQEIKTIIDDYSGWHWINTDPRTTLSPPAMSQIETVRIPTLILVGAGDLDYFKDTASFLHTTIKDSKMEIIPNAGHLSNMENPERVNECIHLFLQKYQNT